MRKNTRNILILLVVLVVLVVIGIIAMGVRPQTAQTRRISEPMIGTLNLDTVKTVAINNNIVLSQYNDVWMYTPFSKANTQGDEQNIARPVRQAYVTKMFTMLKRFGRGRLLSSHPESLDVYRLDEASNPRALLLKNQTGEEVFRVKVGTVEGTDTANYIQINDNPAVYLVDDDLSNILNKDERYWFDLRLFPVAPKKSSVTAVTISRKNVSDISLAKDAKKWTSTSDSNITIDSLAVKKYIDDILFANAYNFSTQTPRDELVDGTVTLNTGSGKPLTVTLYSFANEYFVKTQGGRDDHMFDVKDYMVDKLFPNIDMFKSKEVKKDKTKSTTESIDNDKDNKNAN